MTNKQSTAHNAHIACVVLNKLFETYGYPTPDAPDDILGTLVRALISHQTTAINAQRAFGTLLDAYDGDWHRIAHAPLTNLSDALSVAGLAHQKAVRIKELLQIIYAQSGMYSLDHLCQMDPQDAYHSLQQYKGVGPKTAAFTLMVAAQMPLFPMDTHILRICKRLKWIGPTTTNTQAHERVTPMIMPDHRYAAHMVLVQHGRTCCHARNPACHRCPLAISECPSANSF